MPLKRLLVVLSLLAVKGVWAQNNSDVIDYINRYKELAIREMQRSGVPASITLAQGIHETMAGKSDLVLKSNNHFGIKCRAEWTGEKVYHDDDARGECFRSYPSAADSYADHSDFLKKGQRYAFLFQIDPANYSDWAYGLRKAGYATNIKYSQILIKYIEDYNLQQYTLIALGKISPKDEILAGNGKPLTISNGVAIRDIGVPVVAKPAVNYPAGEFKINDTRVLFAKAGTSFLAIAEQYDVKLKHLLDFNDLDDEGDGVLKQDQLIFLQRKRKTGAAEFHEVQPGESLYDIAQAEGIRLESLIGYNLLQDQPVPAVGEKLYLQTKAPARPRLAEEVANTAPKPVIAPTDQITAANSSAVTASLHIVRDKETLYSIAKKYSITVEQLRDWNKLAGSELKTGQELVIFKN
jgi:LysM repeat protein